MDLMSFVPSADHAVVYSAGLASGVLYKLAKDGVAWVEAKFATLEKVVKAVESGAVSAAAAPAPAAPAK